MQVEAGVRSSGGFFAVHVGSLQFKDHVDIACFEKVGEDVPRAAYLHTTFQSLPNDGGCELPAAKNCFLGTTRLCVDALFLVCNEFRQIG